MSEQTAAERGRRLLIVHGLDLARAAAVTPYAVGTPAVIDAVRAHGAAVLAAAERMTRDVAPGLVVSTERVAGHPAQMVVVGSHGGGGLRGLVLGSTGNWLVQHAHCRRGPAMRNTTAFAVGAATYFAGLGLGYSFSPAQTVRDLGRDPRRGRAHDARRRIAPGP
ncbi:universal stress protein [Nocardia rhizosphaerihabitans]|uniref:UspA domain-containing protein n=1 Tax=Nocardia rhizosphaerihabitans TaxID=1691570 RepID=A0ABQ2KES2_9NOCA|nr:hypothetical protein GCM10011610_31090 [Nocardia rhizosphaerihabitans]